MNLPFADIANRGLLPMHGDIDGTADQIFHSATISCHNRYNRNSKISLQPLYIDHITVGSDFIHHIQCDDHRNSEFRQLKRQIQITFQVIRINDIDNRIRLFIENVISGDHLLIRIGRKRINSRQIHQCDSRIFFHFPGFFLDGYTRPVSDMLVGAG